MESWTEHLRACFRGYGDDLLRGVAKNLTQPRSHWPKDELVERCVQALANPPLVDRRLRSLAEPARRLLSLIGRIGATRWRADTLRSAAAVLGDPVGVTTLTELLDAGFAVAEPPPGAKTITRWDVWMAGMYEWSTVAFHPIVLNRSAADPPAGIELTGTIVSTKRTVHGDGLEWPLRLSLLWQQLRSAPIRLTKTDALFKRDRQRLIDDPILSAPLPESTTEFPDLGALAFAIGRMIGLVAVRDGSAVAADFPPEWSADPHAFSIQFLRSLPDLQFWDAVTGYDAEKPKGTAGVRTAVMLVFLGLLPPDQWIGAEELARAVGPTIENGTGDRTRTAREIGIELAALAVPTGLAESTAVGKQTAFRLTPTGRAILSAAPIPPNEVLIPRPLVVQPNADVIAYRQGLTVPTLTQLARFADWKMIGPACTLGMTADSIYRGLESGLEFGDIASLLHRLGAHETPANVLDLIRRWADKRERIVVHRSATLVEFTSAADLEAGLHGGLVVEKLTDRIGLARGEIDFHRVRLMGNRDYEAKPRQCLSFETDGVTFTVDVSASDLLLEAELARWAEPVPADPGVRTFRMTPESIRRAKLTGILWEDLDRWCILRSGINASPAVRLLFHGEFAPPGRPARRLVVTFADADLADGICQWPPTAALVQERLGPQTVAVAEADLINFRAILAPIGLRIDEE